MGKRVRLKSKFYAPDRTVYGVGVHTIPDDVELPSTAEVIEGDDEVEEKEPSKPVEKKPAAKKT